MLFSILIPAYNTEKYIAECLNSILNQTITDYEIIIVDDFSFDNTLNICKEFQQQYPNTIKIIEHKENKGLLLTRRELFAAMQGDYAICVDSDDWLVPNALEILKKSIEKENADLILYELVCKHLDGREERFNCDLNNGYIYSNNDKQTIYDKLLTSYSLNSMCTKAIKKSIIDLEQDYGVWSSLSNGEDLFQSFPIVDKAEKILYIGEALYCYRKTAGSISTDIKSDFYDMLKILWQREDIYIKKWDVADDIFQRKLVSRINDISLIMRSKQGAERKAFYKTLRKDTLLKKYLNSVNKKNLRFRYSIVCKAAILKLDFLANLFIKLEDILLKLKK